MACVGEVLVFMNDPKTALGGVTNASIHVKFLDQHDLPWEI